LAASVAGHAPPVTGTFWHEPLERADDVRRELRWQPGYVADADRIEATLRDEVIRGEVL
jgi:hypothetical protein